MKEFCNWAGTYWCRPRLYFEPDSIESLRSLLNEISKNQWKVRVIGCAHSPSAISMSNEILISMKHFNRIIEIDREKKEIHCESFVLISTLNEILPQWNLSLPVQGSVSGITVAGAVSTSTHGSGIEFGSLSSYVRSIRLMKLTGEIEEYSSNESDGKRKEIFRCLTCSLGTFAILLSIRLELSDLFHLESIQQSIPFDRFLDRFSIYYRSSDHFRYMWYPYTNRGIAFHLKRIAPTNVQQRKSIFSSIYSWFRHSLIGHHLLELLFYFSLTFPRLVRWINRFYIALDGKKDLRIDRCDRIFNFDCLFRQYASEWAIPIDQSVSCLVKLNEIIESSHVNVHFPIEIRFNRAEDLSYLSPCYGRETCWINIVSYRPYGKTHFQHRKFFEDFERICHEHFGRPHWAKEHPLTRQDFNELYPQWKLFEEKRKEFDPNNLLLNDCLEKVFL